MNEQRVAELLRERELPGEREAEERGWRVVSAAFDKRQPSGPGRMLGRRRLAIALASLVTLGAVVLSPAGAAVGDWIHDAFHPGREGARPALDSLPSNGRLLVNSRRGPWVVQPDGSKRLLGPYGESGWSPSGLFVVATRGRQLLALEPGGRPRWSIARPAPVSRPAWSPAPGYRIAYLSGRDLRVVWGNGANDRLVARAVARVTPAWSPVGAHVVTFADGSGRVLAVEADSGRTLWRSEPGAKPEALAWAPDGRRLISVSRDSLRVLDGRGRLVAGVRLPPGARAGALAIHPSGRTAALVRTYPARRRSEVVSLALASGSPGRRLFAGAGRFSDLAWSPDGRWLLITWPDADQWLFVRASGRPRIAASGNIARQFDPTTRGHPAFPAVSGWCCTDG